MSNIIETIRRKISVPEYFQVYIDRHTNLNDTPKVCCPFHSEDTPSFSFSKDKQVWRCFGACKVGGDVIDMHRARLKLASREAAIESMRILLHLPKETLVSFEIPSNPLANYQGSSASRLNLLIIKLERAGRYVELDEAMSYHEPTLDRVKRLEDL